MANATDPSPFSRLAQMAGRRELVEKPVPSMDPKPSWLDKLRAESSVTPDDGDLR